MACDHLLQLALERGAQDNVTLILARFQPGQCNGSTP
jgi:hypothetical protein